MKAKIIPKNRVSTEEKEISALKERIIKSFPQSFVTENGNIALYNNDPYAIIHINDKTTPYDLKYNILKKCGNHLFSAFSEKEEYYRKGLFNFCEREFSDDTLHILSDIVFDDLYSMCYLPDFIKSNYDISTLPSCYDVSDFSETLKMDKDTRNKLITVLMNNINDFNFENYDLAIGDETETLKNRVVVYKYFDFVKSAQYSGKIKFENNEDNDYEGDEIYAAPFSESPPDFCNDELFPNYSIGFNKAKSVDLELVYPPKSFKDDGHKRYKRSEIVLMNYNGKFVVSHIDICENFKRNHEGKYEKQEEYVSASASAVYKGDIAKTKADNNAVKRFISELKYWNKNHLNINAAPAWIILLQVRTNSYVRYHHDWSENCTVEFIKNKTDFQ